MIKIGSSKAINSWFGSGLFEFTKDEIKNINKFLENDYESLENLYDSIDKFAPMFNLQHKKGIYFAVAYSAGKNELLGDHQLLYEIINSHISEEFVIVTNIGFTIGIK